MVLREKFSRAQHVSSSCKLMMLKVFSFYCFVYFMQLFCISDLWRFDHSSSSTWVTAWVPWLWWYSPQICCRCQFPHHRKLWVSCCICVTNVESLWDVGNALFLLLSQSLSLCVSRIFRRLLMHCLSHKTLKIFSQITDYNDCGYKISMFLDTSPISSRGRASPWEGLVRWVTHMHTHAELFNGLWSGTTWVGRYQKKHSPTHTHPDHQTSFIIFLHLQRSMASSLFIWCAWQSSRTTSLQVLFGLPFGLGPSSSYSIHFFTQSSSFFYRCTCPYQRSLFCCNTYQCYVIYT